MPSDQTPAGGTAERPVPHLFGHGRLSYVQIPARDVQESAAFYASVFGWQIRGGSAAHLSFNAALARRSHIGQALGSQAEPR